MVQRRRANNSLKGRHELEDGMAGSELAPEKQMKRARAGCHNDGVGVWWFERTGLSGVQDGIGVKTLTLLLSSSAQRRWHRCTLWVRRRPGPLAQTLVILVLSSEHLERYTPECKSRVESDETLVLEFHSIPVPPPPPCESVQSNNPTSPISRRNPHLHLRLYLFIAEPECCIPKPARRLTRTATVPYSCIHRPARIIPPEHRPPDSCSCTCNSEAPD